MAQGKKLPLMPKATAVWLVDNTSLTFKQIADFCGMHELEVKAIADGQTEKGIVGIDPIINGYLTREEILRCAQDSEAILELKSDYKTLEDFVINSQIVKLIGTTKSIVSGRPRDPVLLNICTPLTNNYNKTINLYVISTLYIKVCLYKQ